MTDLVNSMPPPCHFHLPQSVLIKRFGNIIKIYAASVASLFAAAISHTLLHDPPPPLFYFGVVLAMVATLQLARARSQELHPRLGVVAAATKYDPIKPASKQAKMHMVLAVPLLVLALPGARSAAVPAQPTSNQ